VLRLKNWSTSAIFLWVDSKHKMQDGLLPLSDAVESGGGALTARLSAP